MKREDIRDWIVTSFKPITLALPNDVLDQIVQSSIDFWNTHSAYKTVRMYDMPTNGSSVKVDNDIKTVVQCYPSVMSEYLMSNHPMWVLLGFITLDRYTQDLMLLSHTFEGYRIYLGNDFRWKWVRPTNPDVAPTVDNPEYGGGYIYIQSSPAGSTKIAVVATKRISAAEEDITDEFIYRWLREHARATVKIWEGNILRKIQIIGVPNDGESLVVEGKEERIHLEEELRKESRWLMMAYRK